jgi:integrase/recombinase XerD
MSAALNAVCASFLETLRVRGCASATLKTRVQSFALLAKFFTGIGITDLREVTREHVAVFQRWLAASSYADQTRRVHLATLRGLFAYLERTGAILLNPCEDMALPLLTKRLPHSGLTRKQALTVLDAPNVLTRTGFRDKAILEVFYATGLRLAELAQLRITDVECSIGFVRVNNGKGGKDRVVPLGATACRCVCQYLIQARDHWVRANPAEQALWLSSISPHSALKAQAIQVRVRHYGLTAGVRVTAHILRHTCATHLVSNGANIAAVQRLLGHTSLATTELYTHVTLSEIKTAYHRAHPRSRSA